MNITRVVLNDVIRTLNQVTGNPEGMYTRDENGQYKTNPGAYGLSYCYDKVAFVQVHKDGGTLYPVLDGFYSTRELYYMIKGYLAGLYSQKKENEQVLNNYQYALNVLELWEVNLCPECKGGALHGAVDCRTCEGAGYITE